MESVVLVTVDSLRPDHVGYRGYERETTPYLDSLAERGSTFSKTYAHAGLTRYSFPSILASVTPLMYGGPDGVVDAQTLVSEAFAAAGYRTGGFHSNLYLSADHGYDRGFDVFFDSTEDPSLATRARTFARKRLAETPVYPLLERAYDFAESTGGVNVGSFHVPADELTGAALEWVDSAAGTRPIFLWVHYMDVHHPYLPPPEYQRNFRDDPVEKREAVRLRRKLLDDPGEVTEGELETVRDLYDAEIRFTDEQVERLVETTRDRFEDLTVVVTADHGEHFLERGFFDGASPYDVKLHVPLLVEGWDDAGTYDDLVGLCDVPPTLLDAAGLDVPSSYRGESLWEVVSDGDWTRTAVRGGYGDDEPTYLYRERDWKFIERPRDDSDELYDLASDPDEQDNVVSAYPDRAKRLRAALERHRDEIRATDADVDPVEVDAAARRRLRRLGYEE
jgi:arylsulfatase A-like enzyme